MTFENFQVPMIAVTARWSPREHILPIIPTASNRANQCLPKQNRNKTTVASALCVRCVCVHACERERVCVYLVCTMYVFLHITCPTVTVCRSVLPCVAACCSVSQCIAVCSSVSQCIAVCSSVLQCVAVCCSAYQLTKHPHSTSKKDNSHFPN